MVKQLKLVINDVIKFRLPTNKVTLTFMELSNLNLNP